MSQFHDIFCLADAPLLRTELAETAVNGWYGDGEPVFGPVPDADAGWRRFDVRLPTCSRPLVFLHDTDPTEIAVHVEEAIAGGRGGLTAAVAERLRRTRQLIGVELAPELLDDDAWELLDILQSSIARRLDGLVVVDDGVYDADLQLIR